MKSNTDAALTRSMDLLKLHQQRSRFIANAYESPLTLIAAYIIIEIDVTPDITLQGLCEILPLHKDVIARTLVRLEKDVYLRRGWSQQDRRQRHYKITAKGRKFLALHDENSRQFLAEYLAKLSITQIAALQRLQHKLCDSVQAPPVKLRSVEHPFEEGIRRVTRALGFIGPSLFGSEYSSTEWQIFSKIAATPGAETLTTLSEQLAIPASTLSQSINRYVKSGLIQKKTQPADKRTKHLVLTRQGTAALASIEDHGQRLLANAFTTAEVKEFNQLLETHLGVGPGQSDLVLRKELHVQPVASEAERTEARAFLVFHTTRLRKYFDLPEEIIATRNKSFVLKEGGALIAVCEVAVNGTAGSVQNCAWSEQCSAEQLLVDFLAAVLTQVTRDTTAVTFSIRSGLFSESVIQRLQLVSSVTTQ